MSRRKHIYIILALSVLFTLIIQSALTKAVFFDRYLETKAVRGGAVSYYLSLINESSKGNWQVGSPYNLEWRNNPYLYPPLNINSAGLFKRIFNLDIKSLSLIMDYAAVFMIMGLVLTAFLMLFQFDKFGYLAAIFYIFYPRIIGWNRTLSPEINFIPLAAFLIFYFSRFNFWKRELGLAVFSGLLFYFYPYYWTFALALLAVSDLQAFIQQKRIVGEYLYKYLIIAGIASWYGLHLWEISHLSYYKESMIRIGALYSRWPAGLYTQLAVLASLSLFFGFKKYVLPKISLSIKSILEFDKIIAGLIASLVVLNQQLITGMQLEFNSHYLPVILMFIVSLWSGLIFVFYKNLHSYIYKKTLFAVLSVLAIGLIGHRAFFILHNLPPAEESYFGDKAPAVTDWFIRNHIQDKVVYAPEELNDDINLLTNNYLYFHGSQELQLMPTGEILDRFTYFDITNRYLTDHLLEEQIQIFGHTFESAMQKDNVLNKIKAKISGRNFTPATLAEYTKYDFEPVHKKRTNPDSAEFIRYLKKYQVSYLVYKQQDKNGIYKAVPGKIVFEDGTYLIKKL